MDKLYQTLGLYQSTVIPFNLYLVDDFGNLVWLDYDKLMQHLESQQFFTH
jgi:hypothetical protein